MALIKTTKMKKEEKIRNNVHNEARGTYTVFEENGEKYFQIDSYGSNKREMTEKISQSFQLDKESAKFLVNLLVKEFNIKY